VLEHYTRLHSHIQAVQKDRSDEVWQPLFKHLQAWAYNFLLRKNFVPGLSTRAIAEECATEAALRILNAHFPYDTDFAPWAHITVILACYRFFRDGTKRSVIHLQNLIELDEKIPGIEGSSPHNQDDRDDLIKAMSELSESRRQAIQIHYLNDMPLPKSPDGWARARARFTACTSTRFTIYGRFWARIGIIPNGCTLIR
jgi:DNA-directed RNA polymerase specialized sigma24 family protein